MCTGGGGERQRTRYKQAERICSRHNSEGIKVDSVEVEQSLNLRDNQNSSFKIQVPDSHL